MQKLKEEIKKIKEKKAKNKKLGIIGGVKFALKNLGDASEKVSDRFDRGLGYEPKKTPKRNFKSFDEKKLGEKVKEIINFDNY